MELMVKLPLSLEVSEPIVVVAPPPSELEGTGLGLDRCGECVPFVGAWPFWACKRAMGKEAGLTEMIVTQSLPRGGGDNRL